MQNKMRAQPHKYATLASLKKKTVSNSNISIGLYRLFFSLSRVDNHLCFINVRVCLFLCSAHIELGH
jgi:hypothetical protein